MEANTKELLLDYVQMGFGVAVVSMSPVAMKRFAGDGRSQLVFHDLSRLFGRESIELFVRRARFQPPHEKAFCDMLLESCASA
jgi:DNA-binding transcriptional LysR family regulator